MKDVSKKTLENLIKFIYTGQVNVAQHNLEEFFNTATALEIEGLVNNGSDIQGASNSSWPARSKNNGLQFQSTQTIQNQSQSPSVYQEGDNFDQKSTNETKENVHGYASNFNADLFDDDTGYDEPSIDQSFESYYQQWNAENYDNQSDDIPTKIIAPQAKRAKRAVSKY